MSPALFFFLGIALAIQCILLFCMNLRILFLYFCEKCHWNFDRDFIESID